MRFRIIYAFYIAVTLLGLASARPVSADAQPADDQPGESSVQKTKTPRKEASSQIPMRIGLLTHIDYEWVKLSAPKEVRASAQYAVCFASKFCPFYIPPSKTITQAYVGHIAPQRKSGSKHGTQIDMSYYERLKLSALYDRRAHKVLEEKLWTWYSGVEAFTDGRSFVLDLSRHLYLDGSLSLPKGKSIEDMLQDTADFMDALKADDVGKALRKLMPTFEYRELSRQHRPKLESAPGTKKKKQLREVPELHPVGIALNPWPEGPSTHTSTHNALNQVEEGE
ncbi:hypothetical protein EV361DRAFT_294855 [Lentinula raphanica]|uniref:HNH nuclease domain-containing protein n=1 Tax=Lentinula raphanica TaxID=153919 RepID=A0AA38P4X6_9AGAR|nr:hypothetical protein F5878DRAFT_625197 [Lentinula raphanica]KAJ3970236.1 hypothetical protein EV361DRAFT_294855 [Lentinula raphanica]